MKKLFKIYSFSFLMPLFLFSCGAASHRYLRSGSASSDKFITASEESAPSSRGGRYKSKRYRKEDPKPASPRKERTRLMIYEASLVSAVKELDLAVVKTKSIVKKYKGYIQKQIIQKQPARAIFTIRVPVKHFDISINELSKIGRVVSCNIKAQDITKEFADLSQRLENRKRLLRRLYTILQKTKKTKQKIRILNTIARLQKEIDVMQNRQKYLAKKASYSTINMQFNATRKLVINTGTAIRWIHRLQPKARTLWGKPSFEMDLPKGFINNSKSFYKKGRAMFLSPDGVQIRTASIDNNPRGDISFYQKSFLYEQKRFPDSIVSSTLVGNQFLMTVPRLIGYQNTFYTIQIEVDGDKIHIVEVFYPTKKAYNKHKLSIENALKTMQKKSSIQSLMEAIW